MLATLKFLWTHPLLRGRPCYAFGRFLAWQLRSRLCCEPVVFPWVAGSKLWLRRGWHGLTGNYYAGLYDFEDMGFLLHFLRPGDLFVDVGANMGSYTVLASAVCRTRSISFEPVPATYGRLVANCELNSLASLADCRPFAVGAAHGYVAMTSGFDAGNHVISDPDPARMTTKVVALDDVLAEPPLLIKIDVEGFESEVLQGARRLLSDPRLKAIIIELNGLGRRFGRKDTDIDMLLAAAGFTACRYSPEARTLSPASLPVNANVIYCRDTSFIEARLRTAEAFTAAQRKF